MVEKEKKSQEAEGSEILQVTPVDSPSENFLVTEHLQRIPNLFSRGLVYIIILVLFSALVYSLLAKIDIVAECNAVARPTSHMLKILSDRSGYIEKVFVAEGQIVEKDAPLFLIRSKETITCLSKVEELRPAIPLKAEHFDTKISAANDAVNQLEREHVNSLQVKKLKLEQNNLSLESIASDLSYWEQEKESVTEEHESIEELFKKGIISIREYNYTKGRLEKARTEVEKLFSKRQITLKENNIIEEEIDKEEANYKNRKMILEKEMKNLALEKKTMINTMQNELAMHEQMLLLQGGPSSRKKDQKETEKMVRAENAGTISELFFRNAGEYVRESDLLCTILPAEMPLYMDITVANQDIGFIEKDMEIKYKFDAFPYTDYGILFGKVLAISPSAVERESLGFVYHVQGSLDQVYFEIKGKKYSIKPGMTATAELVTENKSIFSFLFRKLKGKK